MAVQRGQSRALLIGFQRFAIGFDLEQHVAAPHAPAKHQIRGGDAAADGGAYRVHMLHLEARSRAYFVNRDLAAQEPGAPDSEERSNEDEADYGRPRAVGLECSEGVRERDGHGYRPSDETRRGVPKNPTPRPRPLSRRDRPLARAARSLRLQTNVELEFELELERLAAPVTPTPSRSEICLNAH